MISIIVPTFNEEEVIYEFLYRIKKLKLKNAEIIIVDDSFDNTSEIAKKAIKKLKLNGKVIKRVGKIGKGSAIRDGLKIAKRKYIVIIDADLQYPVEKIPKIVEKLKYCDIVVTKRLRKDKFYRKLFGYIFRIFVFFLFGLEFDTQSGMKAFKKEVKEKIEFYSNYWAWDVEFLYKAKKQKFKICSYPIVFSEREKGKSKIKLSSFLKILIEILKIKFLKYENQKFA
jgi:glycosyltransferase involved in cell wall biosynthesis